MRSPTKVRRPCLPALLAALLAASLTAAPAAVQAQAARPVYEDGLAEGWADRSWDCAVDLANGAPVHAGSHSLAARYTAAWGGLSLQTDAALNGADYAALRFWIRSGSAVTRLQVKLADAALDYGPGVVVTGRSDDWWQLDLPLSTLGSPAQIRGVLWQDTSGAAQPTFFLDDVVFVGRRVPPTPTVEPGPTPTATSPPTADPTTAPTPPPTARPVEVKLYLPALRAR